MSIIAHNPTLLANPAHRWCGARFVIAWLCTRAKAGNGALQRARFVVAMELLDPRHMTLEAWLESDDKPSEPICAPHQLHCHMAEMGELLHIDSAAHDPMFALTLANIHDRPTVAYARTSLLAACGLACGAFDAPALSRIERLQPRPRKIRRKKNPVARARHAQPALLVRRGRF